MLKGTVKNFRTRTWRSISLHLSWGLKYPELLYQASWVRGHVKLQLSQSTPKNPDSGEYGRFPETNQIQIYQWHILSQSIFSFPFPWPTRATDVKTMHSVPQKGHQLFLLQWSHKNTLCQEARGKAQTSKRSVFGDSWRGVCLLGKAHSGNQTAFH